MANEFKHKDPCTTLTSCEYIGADGTGHIFACQATGDILYASSATVLKNLGRGAANTVLHMGGSCIPAWTASPSVTDLTIGGGCITLSAATDIDLLDNNASALSFDASGKTGIIDIVTTDCSEGVTMSGTLGVTGVLTATGGIELSHACQNTLTGSGGCLSVEGNVVYRAGGTDVPVADGGTGASTLTDGGVLLGSGTSAVTAMAVLADGEMIVGDGTTDPVAESGATLRTSIGVGTGDSPQFTDLTLTGGCITITNAATDIDLIDNNACALSFDASGQAGILAIDTQDCAEGVKMSGKLTVTGAISSTGALTVGVDDTGHDVKFFGAAAGAFMLYDQSCDQLEIRGASADATTSTGKLLLSTSLTNVNANDVIGSINFQAPAEAGGTDAITIAAGIRAVAQATFTCAVNATDLIFYTGHSEAATEKFRFTSQGEIGIGGANYGTDGQVLTSAGAGAAAAWECAGGSARSVAGDTDNAIISWVTSDNTFAAEANLLYSSDYMTMLGSACSSLGINFGTSGDNTLGIIKYCTTHGRFDVQSNNATNAMVIEAGKWYLRDNANCNMSKGATLNQLCADNQIFALKSSDVAHPMTAIDEADTYASFSKHSAATGGLLIKAFEESNPTSVVFQTNSVGDNSTKSTSARAHIEFQTRKSDGGTDLAYPGSDANLFAVGSSAVMRFIFDNEGTAHADVGTATYDDYCDVELLRGLLATTCDQYKQNYTDKFGQELMYNQEWYEDNKILGRCSIHYETRDCGRVQQRAMINFTGLTMLHHSTIIQLADRLNDRIDGIETQLKALTEGK
jgi:hypothetical protein